MKTVDLIDAVRSTGDIHKKFEYVVTALSTASIAQTNTILAILSALDSAEGIDKGALRKEIEELRDNPVTSNDLIPIVHTQMLDLFLSRLT